MPITPFDFTLPNRLQTQAVFDAAIAKLMNRLPQWGSEVTATEANIVALAAAVALQSNAAVNAMNSVLSVANTTKWVAGTNYAQGVTTWSPTDFLSYRRKVAGVSATDPSLDPSGWALVIDHRPYWRQASGGNIAVSQTLNANSANVLEYTPTAANLYIALQDATTLKIGPATQLIANKSTRYDLSVRDCLGELLCVIPPGGFVTMALRSQATSSGEWSATGPGVKYVQNSLENFLIGTVAHPAYGAKAYIKMSESVVVYIGRNGGTCYLQAHDMATGVGSAVAVTGFEAGSAGNGLIAGFMISASAGSIFALSSNNATLYAVGFTLSGTAITAGAVATKATGGLTRMVEPCFQRHVAQLGSSFAVAVNFSSTKPGIVACQVTGTSAVWGNVVDTGFVMATSLMIYGIFPVSATQVAVIAGGTSGLGASLATISGSVVTSIDQNSGITATAVSSNSGHKIVAALQMNTDEWWFILGTTGSTIVGMRLKRVSAATVDLKANAIAGAPQGDYLISPIDSSAPGGYCPDNHSIFNKFDSTAAWLYVPNYTTVYMLRLTHDGTNFISAGNSPVPSFVTSPSGCEWNRPPFVAGPTPPGCYLALMRGFTQGQTVVQGRVAFMDIDMWSANVPRARASFPIDLYSDNTTPAYNDHEVFYRNTKAHFVVTTGRAVNQYAELISFDTTSGAVLSRHRINRITGGAQGGYNSSAERSVFTMSNGRIAISYEKNCINMTELAK